MFRNVIQVSKNVIKIYYYTNVEETEKMLFINYWKTAEALERPKGITAYLKNL